jgi:hypothetical protein
MSLLNKIWSHNVRWRILGSPSHQKCGIAPLEEDGQTLEEMAGGCPIAGGRWLVAGGWWHLVDIQDFHFVDLGINCFLYVHLR